MKQNGKLQWSFNFGEQPQMRSDLLVKVLNMPDADVQFYPAYFHENESDKMFQELLGNIKWSQEKTKYYGKEINLPRLTAWYGDKGASYTYSHISNQPHRWTATLLHIKSRVEQIAKVNFNSVLLNLYRNGRDGVAWHQDNESELGENPVIASVSFGDTRRFQFRHSYNKELPKVEVNLTHGSLLIMKGTTQQFWQHQIPKSSKPVGLRINLTFRLIR